MDSSIKQGDTVTFAAKDGREVTGTVTGQAKEQTGSEIKDMLVVEPWGMESLWVIERKSVLKHTRVVRS